MPSFQKESFFHQKKKMGNAVQFQFLLLMKLINNRESFILLVPIWVAVGGLPSIFQYSLSPSWQILEYWTIVSERKTTVLIARWKEGRTGSKGVSPDRSVCFIIPPDRPATFFCLLQKVFGYWVSRLDRDFPNIGIRYTMVVCKQEWDIRFKQKRTIIWLLFWEIPLSCF